MIYKYYFFGTKVSFSNSEEKDKSRISHTKYGLHFEESLAIVPFYLALVCMRLVFSINLPYEDCLVPV